MDDTVSRKSQAYSHTSKSLINNNKNHFSNNEQGASTGLTNIKLAKLPMINRPENEELLT